MPFPERRPFLTSGDPSAAFGEATDESEEIMRLTDLLKQEAEHGFDVVAALFELADGQPLGWKPPSGRNWMTLGQLLMHCTQACGAGIRGFVTGDWGLPEGTTFEDLPPEQALPPAEALPAATSVEQALLLLAEDRQLACRFLDEAGEEKLLGHRCRAPWGGPELTLFQQLLHMVDHLDAHKSQLYYYLKLLGRDVNTTHLWGA
jgi:uncharacterized damage-inducible protein DinB